jgi:hypothetical protein
MSTEYNLRCVVHNADYPDGAIGLRHYQIPATFAIADHRAAIIELGALEVDWEVTPWNLSGLYELATFLRDHQACELTIWDEYGRQVERCP